MGRPIVRCPTFKYNIEDRAGRGFTLEELKGAGLTKNMAKTTGISVDHRRKNKSLESLQRNVQRLKEYQSKLILFPVNSKKPRKGEATEEDIKKASQLAGNVLPIKPVVKRQRAMELTDDMKNFKPLTAFVKHAPLHDCGVSEPKRPRKPKLTICRNPLRSK